MRFFWRLLAWLLPKPLHRLEARASKHGIVMLQQVNGAEGMEWFCTIRPVLESGYKGHAWTATGGSIPEAMELAIDSAEDNPQHLVTFPAYAPKLGGKEFDGDEE